MWTFTKYLVNLWIYSVYYQNISWSNVFGKFFLIVWLSRISELFENVTQFQKDFDPILNGHRSFLLKREVSEQSPSSIARAASSLLNGINVSLIVIGGSTKDLICPLDWVANNYWVTFYTTQHSGYMGNFFTTKTETCQNSSKWSH